MNDAIPRFNSFCLPLEEGSDNGTKILVRFWNSKRKNKKSGVHLIEMCGKFLRRKGREEDG
jgi:hypothetical protein